MPVIKRDGNGNVKLFTKSATIPTMRRACVIALLPLLLASARADDKPDLQKIIDAWKAREKKVESFDFRWWSKRFEDGRSNVRARAEAAIKHVAVTPIPDVTHITKYRFLMDAQGRIRFEESGKEWASDKAEIVPRTFIDIFDGKIGKMQFLGGAMGFPTAHFCGVDSHRAGKSIWLYPLIMIYRPFNQVTGVFASKTLTLIDKTATVENDPVIVLDHGAGEVWVDPAKDYLPVRYTERRTGFDRDRWRMELSYKHDDANGWVPHAWVIKMLDSLEKPQISESATVAGFSINKPIADSEFELDLSAGAYVDDQTKNELYFMMPDGTHRPIPPGEFTAKNYEELLKSEPDSK